MRTLKLLLLAIALLILNYLSPPTMAQEASGLSQHQVGTEIEVQKLNLERKKHQDMLDLEREKHKAMIDLEREKHEKTLSLERDKHNANIDSEFLKSVISSGAVAVPLLVAIGTIWHGIKIQDRQAEAAREARRDEAQTAFELKIAEIALNAPGANEVSSRAKLLKELFQQRLQDFNAEFDPSKYPRLSMREGRKDLLQLLTANVDQKDEILMIYQQIWPGDDWAQKIKFDSSHATGKLSVPYVPIPTPSSGSPHSDASVS
jgi:hypothetical protein